jgi:type IV conjugative transfer system protein TraL
MALWSACTNVIDEPLKIFFWELEDFQIIWTLPFVLNFVTGGALALGIAVVVAVLVYRLKRGKPSGALWHALHWLQLVPQAGLLPPYTRRYSPW